MAISALSTDVIQTHILTRLDGPSLAAVSCTSSQLRDVSTDDKLWQQICSGIWKSIDSSLVRQVISTFPGGHRSFFLDSFPLLDHHQNHPPTDLYHDRQDRSLGPSNLISAVDIYYDDKVIFSRVVETNTTTRNFLCYPFKVDLQVPKSSISIPTPDGGGEIEFLVEDLKEKLSLSWIVIDPIVKRSANLSSRTPVSIDWPCSTSGDVQLFYSTFIADRRFGSEFVECRLAVTCSGVYEGEVRVDDVSLEIVDLDERGFDGRASLVILQNALRNGRRRRRKRAEDEEEAYEELEKMKRERKETEPPRREKVMYMVSVSLVTCVALWASLFLFLALYLRFQVSKVCTKIRSFCCRNSANAV